MVKDDQHFLIDDKIAQKIANSVDSEDVLEIGPGKGALTKYLVSKNLTAVEKDSELAKYVRETFEIPVHNRSVLQIRLTKFKGALVSNLPYSISEPFFYRLVTSNFEEIVLTTGKKFYDIIKEPKSKIGIYGNEFFEVKKLFVVPKKAFDPQPRVESVCFKLIRKERTRIQSILGQYDKKLKNALVKSLSKNMTKRESKSKIDSMGISEDILSKRIMHLSNAQFMKVFDKIKNL